jgi:uncharacterized membrane protein
MARRNVSKLETIYKFLEVALNMDFNNAKFFDEFTNGQYSKDMEAFATEKAAALEAEKAAAVEAEKAAAVEAEMAAVITIAVMALYAENKSPKEISLTLKLEEAEVLRILKNNGNGK